MGKDIVQETMVNYAPPLISYGSSIIVDALPSPGVNPLEGSPKCSCGKRDSEGRSQLPTLEMGRGSSWEPKD